MPSRSVQQEEKRPEPIITYYDDRLLDHQDDPHHDVHAFSMWNTGGGSTKYNHVTHH